MKIKIEKKLNGDDFFKTEELHIELPKTVLDEMGWEDCMNGTVVEWEIEADGVAVFFRKSALFLRGDK
jgi:hypothetical protein